MLRYFTLLLFVGAGCAQVSELQYDDSRVQPMSVDSNYASIRDQILVPKCIECHNKGSESPHKIDLTSYENILDQTNFPPLVTVGSPEESSLYLSIAPEGKMPKDRPRLPGRAVRAVYDWIKNGAKESE